MSVIEQSSRGYLFGPLEKRGVLAGLRGGQLITIASSLLTALAILSILPGTMGLPFALGAVAVGAAISWVQPGGRGVDEWIPVLFRWFIGTTTKRNQWFSVLPLLGSTDTPDDRRVQFDEAPPGAKARPPRGNSKGTPPKKRTRNPIKRFLGTDTSPNGSKGSGSQDPPLPPSLQGLIILEVPVGEGLATIGVIKDSRAGTFTGVLAVRGDTFALLEQGEKEQRLQAWADVLGGMARPSSYVHRVQWLERAVPDDGDALNRYLQDSRTQPDSAPTARSYIDLLEQYGPVSQQHETFVAVQVSANKAGRVIKKAGGGDKGACLVLIREIRNLADSLASADIHVDGVLSPRLLALTFRNAFDPHARRSLVRKGRVDPSKAGVSPSNAWPLATEAKWDHYRSEDVYHATFWIAEWPRLEVGPDFMSPLMVRTQRIRSVSLIMEPIDSTKAQREVESAHTAYVSDEELRGRAGYMPSERRRRELDGVLRREQELADGFAEYRFAGYVTVTGSTEVELEEACTEIEQAAQQARLELRRLYGEQDVAFTCTLPLCRGLN